MGSHILEDHNGIKFNRNDGDVLTPDESGIRTQSINLSDLFNEQGMSGVSVRARDPPIVVTIERVALNLSGNYRKARISRAIRAYLTLREVGWLR